MIKVLVFLVVLAALAFGFAWIADQPGSVSVVAGGQRYDMDLVVALGIGIGIVITAMIVWSVVRFVFRIPTLMSLTARMRRRNKGYAALTRGMVAAGAGDARGAARAARDAEKLIGPEPLALLLSAQAAQMNGDRAGAERAFRRMADNPETRLLALRGLHAEARRRGDDDAAAEYAREAHEMAAAPWAGQAVLERRAMADDWAGALQVVETNLARKAVDRQTADRQRAALKTALAMRLEERDPAEALALAREAQKLSPDLVPASVLAGALLARRGDLRRAAKILEAAWRANPHPDIARAYVELRSGDAAGDRLSRARALARLAPGHAESQLAIARAALEARDFDAARRSMSELIEGGRRPTARMCLMMADIEETEHGPSGRVREWLARAARAPRDPAWVADGVVSDRWLPASPATGQIDAFRWETPVERLAGPAEEPLSVWAPVEPVPADVEHPHPPAHARLAPAAMEPDVVFSSGAPDQRADVARPAPEVIDLTPAPAPPPAQPQAPAAEPLSNGAPDGAAINTSAPSPDRPGAREGSRTQAAAPAPAPETAKPSGQTSSGQASSGQAPSSAKREGGRAARKLPQRIVTAPDDPGAEASEDDKAQERRRRFGIFG